MRKNNFLLSLVTIGAISVFASASGFKSISEEQIGLRKTNIYEEKVELKDKLSFNELSPGESKLIKRSFENAPPLIPHSVEGLVPITTDNNSCLGCHSPEIASAVNATPVPKSHLNSFRPVTKYKDGVLTKDGKKYENTADVKTKAHAKEGISLDRFNCTLCHVPQTNNAPLVKNKFNPEFRDENGSSKSNLIDVLNEGVNYKKSF